MTKMEKIVAAACVALLVIVATAPKRGRPVTTGTTPAKDRKAKERAARATAGGERLNINLTPQGAADLAAIQAKHPGMSKTEVIHNLMRGYMLD